ncbi:MAG TPA: hypothetical protein VF818_09110 [Ktedonobacterales bacterium]
MAWLFGRPKKGWWHAPAGWALGVALTFPSGLLAIPVSQYTGSWAVLAESVGLAIALAATVGFFVVKRHSWLLAAPLSFGLSFSLFLALVEGWNTQINVVLAVAKVAFVVAAIGLTGASVVITGRGLRRLSAIHRDIAREIGEQIAHEGLFRDDGERIVVHANRGRVVLQALMSVAVLALLVAGGLWAHADIPNVF